MDQTKIGLFLKELRYEKGITQEQLAEQLNVSNRSVSRWETGSTLPDISLLVELAEFYEVDIKEIIDGERKSEIMKKEEKEIAEKMSDYATLEKETMIKEIRKLSLIGVISLIIYFLMQETGLDHINGVTEIISLYFETLTYVTVILIPLYTTGMLEKIRKRNIFSQISGMPRVVLYIVCGITAFVVAAVLKFILMNVFGL